MVPLQMPDSFEKIEKKCAGTASGCNFLREKVRKSGKTWGNSVKNYPFSAGNTQNGGVLEKKWNFRVFWSFGASSLRILPSYFWPAPLQRPKGNKKVSKKKIDRQWVQTSAKPRFIEIEIEKSRFLIEKKSTPNPFLGRGGSAAATGGPLELRILEGADPLPQQGGSP